MTARPEPPPRAVLDANVLLQAPVRDTLLRAADAALFLPAWGLMILAEVERHLPKLIPQHANAPERARRLVEQLQVAFPRAWTDDKLAGLPLGHVCPLREQVDPGDGHVVAAACSSGAGTIVTNNVRHFPQPALTPLGIVATTPDQFLLRLWASEPREMVTLLAEQGASLHPPRTLRSVLETLARTVPQFVSAVGQYEGLAE